MPFSSCKWNVISTKYLLLSPLKKSKFIEKLSPEIILDLDKDISDQLVRQFNASAAIGFLPPLRDAQYYIKMLHEKHKYKFIAVTSLSLDPYAQKLRKRNLAKLFGKNTFEDVICLDTSGEVRPANQLRGETTLSIWRA